MSLPSATCVPSPHVQHYVTPAAAGASHLFRGCWHKCIMEVKSRKALLNEHSFLAVLSMTEA